MHIPAPHGHLEAHLRPAEAPLRGLAVVCHPHPLHGGTMHTKAVFRTAQALNEVGLHALRFNFRGVGASTGSHDEGIGEVDDVKAALDWLLGEYGERPVLLGGFSFGSRVALSAGIDDERVGALLGLGVPVKLYDFGFLEGVDRPVHVIQGENDEFGAGPEIQELIDELGGRVTLDRIPGSGHFFDGHFEQLGEAVRRYVTDGGAAGVFPEATDVPDEPDEATDEPDEATPESDEATDEPTPESGEATRA